VCYGELKGMNKTRAQEGPNSSLDEAAGLGPWPAEMCKAMIESSPWPMFVLDCELRCVVEANGAAIAKYQMSRENLRARGVEEVLPAHRRAELNRLLDARLDGPALDTVSEHILPDRTLLPVEVRSFPLLWNDRPSRFFMVRDLLPRPAAGWDTKLAGEIDLIGRVSGSVAHDFNNLLTVILAVAEQLQEGEGDPEQQIELIAKTVRSAQDLAHQRLSLGGSQAMRRERLDLNAVLSEQAEVLGVLLGKQIELEMDFDSELWPVLADAAQWREVVLNLAVNARDAMPEGGKLYISTHHELVTSDNHELGLARGRYAHLVVRDTGHGMTEDTRLHAFKPYFSTKSRSRNSGLGLASVHAVVQQSGGSIRLRSAPGEGARFDIFILTARGYEVIACGSAEVALKWARTLARKLDLVICDLILPDLPGDMLIEQLREQRPETKVIFMSGQHGAEDAMQAAGEASDIACLEKPFSLHQLAQTIAETLGSAADPARVDSIQGTG
jgi:two-component system cell cycle sensor histidine kinase/response regulator CckA